MSHDRLDKQRLKDTTRRSVETGATWALRRPWVRKQAFNLLSLLSPSGEAEVDGVHYLFSTQDRVVGRHLYTSGPWEHDTMRSAVLVGQQIFAEPLFEGRTFVDVGSNIGTATIAALRHFGAVRSVAIEPNPACTRYLRLNVTRNGLAKSVAVVEVAASDVEGFAELELTPTNSGGGYLSKSDGDRNHGNRRRVPTRRLDDVLADAGVHTDDVGLIWVDAQAHERQVLLGADSFVQSGTPFVLEFWPDGLRQAGEYDGFVDQILRTFPTIFHIRSTPTSPVSRLRDRRDFERLADLVRGWETDLLVTTRTID